MKIGKINVLQLVIAMSLGLILGVGSLTLANRTRPAALIIGPPPPTAQPEPSATPQPLRVYINGAVTAPGVYELPVGSRVEDVLALAGGMTAEAFEEGVNLAELLFDGAQVYVSAETPATSAQSQVTANIVSGSTIRGNASSSNAAEDAAKLVNLNAATLDQLELIPGVGPATAQKIIDYREANGDFALIEDIMNVSGIGEGKFEKMQSAISVGK